MRGVFDAAFQEAERLLNQFRNDESQMEAVMATAALIREAFLNGGKVLICGNGGSMADAMHFAEEWTGRFRNDREPYPAIALSDPTHLSCVANDYGYEHVFSRQVQALGRPGDVLIVLSTSGESPTILRAAETARRKGLSIVGFLGRGGGPALTLCDTVVMAPGKTSDRIQEIHMLALHAVIEAVERELGHTI